MGQKIDRAGDTWGSFLRLEKLVIHIAVIFLWNQLNCTVLWDPAIGKIA